MGSLSHHSCIASAALLLAAAAAYAQQAPSGNQPGGITDRQGVRRDTSSTKYALPSIKIQSLGVKSKAPRGIGRKGGVLLPPPLPPAPSPRAVSDAEIGPVPGTGRSADRDAVTPYTPSAGGAGAAGFDRNVLTSGDNVAIARMLRPAIAYSYLSRRAQLQKMTRSEFPCMTDISMCCAFADYFNTVPDAMTFRVNDTYVTDTYQLDSNGKDAFVSGAASGPGSGPAGVPAMVDPEVGLTDFEKAGNRLYDGKPEQAIVLLRGYVDSHPDEPDAARGLALALIDARRTKEGVELMADVYAKHPTLAADPLPDDAVGPEYELRDLVVRTVEHAHSAKSASAWLTVAVLMQAQGRVDQALKMIDRADSAGLAADVSAAMRSALNR